MSPAVPAPDGARAVRGVVHRAAKSRLHPDVTVSAGSQGDKGKAAVREPARRLVAAGATLVGERTPTTGWWVVLTDPEGNEFCLQ